MTSKAEKELFLEQILLRDLRLDIFELKKTKSDQSFSDTMNYPQKTGFNLYLSRHCAYITYNVKTWFLKNLSVCEAFWFHLKKD